MSKNLYVDFHVIQNVPPSCINRDDTGSPKTAIYGGTMRARVSSQAWKRAMRLRFKDESLFPSDLLGVRTRHHIDLVADRIQEDHPEIAVGEAKKMASTILKLAKSGSGNQKKDSKKASGDGDETEEKNMKSDGKKVMFLLSNKQIGNIAELAVKYHSDAEIGKDKKMKECVESALQKDPSIDILLFGRMAADNTNLEYDAAAQVAHSISTHTVSNEYDYFTAVDEFEKDKAGAGHLGTVEFNSATLYRYATVNVRELAENLNPDELKLVIKGFAEAFVRSMPTGRQNTFANATLPDMIYVTLREDQPINLVGAFEKPIYAGTEGYLGKSETALVDHAKDIYQKYAAEPKKAWIVGDSEEGFAEKVNFKELLEKLENEIV